MSRRRELSDEEEALWRGVARSVKPLRPSKTKAKAAGKSAPGSAEKKPVPLHSPKPLQPVAPASPRKPLPKPPPVASLDRREKKRVVRGRDAIDARIDLHGMTQSEAH